MINTAYLLAICLLASMAVGLRQSDAGNNDWSIENIGKIDEINFLPFNPQADDHKANRQFRSLFYYSELGIFGHLSRRTGEIEAREFLREGENVIESDDKELVILTKGRQIVRYNKLTMHRLMDNRLAGKEVKNLHSYVRANGKIYASDENSVFQFESSPKKVEQLSNVPAPAGCVFLKIFATVQKQVSTLHALTYYPERQEVCTNEIKEKGLIEKNCMKAKLGPNPYVKAYENTGNVYFGDNSEHYYINFLNFDSQKFNSKPITFAHFGVKFENGLTFTTRGLAEDRIMLVESNRDDKTVYGELKDGHLYVHLGSETEIGDKLATICLEGRDFKVSRVWANFLSHAEVEVVVEFEDLQLVLFSQQGKQFKQLWSREQSLAYVQKVLFMKYEGYQDHLNNPYHMKMDDIHYIELSLFDKLKQIPINFIARVRSEFEDVFNFFIQKIQGCIKTFTDPRSFEELLNIKGYMKSTMSSDKEKRYGLQKYIIVITKYGTMFSLDTKTSTIIWKKKSPQDQTLVTLIKLKQEYQKQIAIAITYRYHITYITQIHEDGSTTELKQFQTVNLPTVHKISPHSVLIRAEGKVHRFDANKELMGREKEYGFYSVEGARVVGWAVQGEELRETWGLVLPATQRIVSTKSAYRGQPEANLPLVNDKKVLFKNVDFSNIAILTLEDYTQQAAQGNKASHRLHLYLINGLTGTILFSEYQTGINPKLPMNLVYDQHNAIVSYYNMRNRVYEIWTVEAFQTPLESELISKKYQPEFQKQGILFRSKVYGTVLPIKHIFISESKQALLRRNLLIITRQNKINSLPRQLVSSRRPKTAQPQTNAAHPDAEYTSSKYPPEEYIIPANTLGYLNYNKELCSLDQMRFSSSDLESTIFVMAYGIDIFLARVAPDKAFDMLADGFNYLQLLAVVVAVTLAALFFRSKAKEAKLKRLHLD